MKFTDDELVKSKLTKREELRYIIHQSVGDTESLFSADSDLLQLVVLLILEMYTQLKDHEIVKQLLLNIEPTTFNLLVILYEKLQNQQNIFPIEIKQKYKLDQKIIDDIVQRYASTASHLECYYQKTQS
ncbi:hypothetical protein L3V83_05320 [Thiotrichales bacterium 19X7-9]|nr:hypothetical protein [Thiotrichales bacterium 19X7-9]